MADFVVRFLLCNLLISGIIGILLLFKQIFRNILSSRMQYHLWFLLLGLLVIPFLPFPFVSFVQLLAWTGILPNAPMSAADTAISQITGTNLPGSTNWINDFTLSVNKNTPFFSGYLLPGIWIAGMIFMILLMAKSSLHLCALKKSALPLQNPDVRRLYKSCLDEIGIRKYIPVYSTAFLKSPVITGLLSPCIYLPLHLISDYAETDMRYMLLHELQHYKHKDMAATYLMNLAGVIYWFNPFIWYVLKEMRNDREIACDTSVLEMLEEDSYEDYGNTLINFAEKLSLTPFPFVSGLSGNMKQMKRRIINIASYQKPTFRKKLKGTAAFLVTAILLFGLAPFISISAADDDHYHWNVSSERISYIDLSSYFGNYEGCFVLYDSAKDFWNVHDLEHAALRIAPNSTYKIYDALFGLEEGIITSADSFIPWDKKTYPIAAWNADQTLESAMSSSVNWYFQSLDQKLGFSDLRHYIRQIGYGNENLTGDLSSYWMESSLKISPLEQVELLVKLHDNSFGFTPENISTVKESICLSTSKTGTFYGKTGTGRVNGRDVNGWFIGFIETADNTYYFATNISADSGAAGSSAAEITLSILSDKNIWQSHINGM